MTPHSPLVEIADVARPIIERVVWATVATVGPDGHPRTRLMHPVWFWDDDAPIALVSARPTPLKLAHLAAQPAVSCLYWDPAHDTVAVEATATWLPADQRQDAWDRIKAVPEPVGFDPAIIWPEGSGADDCAFLRFAAHRIVARPAGTPGLRWDRAAP
ncbi:MAG: pyridoxamine 5'-phosphate oxidase family protein [Actinomycetota bacterium]